MIWDGWFFTARHYITMGLRNLFADNAIVRLVRGDSGQADMAVSMTGVKLGERLLVIGLGDARLLQTLGAKVGLTGRACGTDAASDVAARAARYAEKEGVLAEVETSPLGVVPFEAGTFDVVVVRATGTLVSEGPLRLALEGATAALREGGRCEVIADSSPDRGPMLVSLLGDAGFRGSRVLTDRGGLLYVEAVKRGRA